MQLQLAKARLVPLLTDVAAGGDLEPYLSELARKSGIDLARSFQPSRRRDIDMVLTRDGLHHFHVGARTKSNPKGRSDTLAFAEVLQDQFRIV